MTKGLKPLLFLLTVLLTGLTIIGAFLNGYEPATIFGHPTTSMGDSLVVATWICALLASCTAFLGDESSNSDTPSLFTSRFIQKQYLRGDRSDIATLRGFPYALWWFPIALLGCAWGIGILVSPADTDVIDGWAYLIFGIFALIISGVVQVRHARRRNQLRLISTDGIDTVGVVCNSRMAQSSDMPITRPRVEFTDTAGDLRSARAVLNGHLEAGTKLNVRYLADAPQIKPAIRTAARKKNRAYES